MAPLSVCLSCLSVTLVYCAQTVRWNKMKLGTDVGVGPGHIVLDGDPAPPPPKGHSPHFLVHVCWPNGWMDQDATWYGGRPQSRRHCVTWGTQLPPKKWHRHHFSAHVYCGQMVTHLSYC